MPTPPHARVWLRSGALATVMLLALGLRLVQLQHDEREWMSSFDASQSEITWASTSLMLEHYRLGAALRHFVTEPAPADVELARERLIERFDIYLSRYAALGADVDRSLEQLDWAVEMSPSSRARMTALDTAFEKLNRRALTELVEFESVLRELEPGDAPTSVLLMGHLDALGDGVRDHLLGTHERARYVNRARRVVADRLANRLRVAGIALLLAVGCCAFVLLAYVGYRGRSVAMLAATNERLAREVDESARLADELERRATHDSLSTLLNRRGFSDELAALLDAREGQHGLCFIDLDHFKVVNDTCGHAAGDRLIVELGAIIAAQARAGDSVSRHGGDEFVLLLRDCPPDAFQRRVRTLCDTLRDYRFDEGGRRFDVSGSIGAVHFDAADTRAETLLATADAACYVAKRAGGARVHFHGDEDGLLEARRDEMEWITRIQGALDEGRFRLFRQPLRALADGAGDGPHGHELLLRMLDANDEPIPPGPFLDVAERYSLATAIDRWVIGEAFSRFDANPDPDPDPDPFDGVDTININLSGRSVGDAEFLAFLEERTATLSIPPSRICFELTETAVMGERAREFLVRLKALGYRLALDDFGSGFSSFGYLEALPVDSIKIDGRFVRDIDTNAVHREFVRAITVVGRAMGKHVVAEFVGSDAALAILRELGVDYAQGYHVGLPEPIPDRLPKAASAPRRAERGSTGRAA